jgi:hypothetical protein
MPHESNLVSTHHPHEPAIPPAYDPEGRCLICGLLVRGDELAAKLESITLDAIDDPDWWDHLDDVVERWRRFPVEREVE